MRVGASRQSVNKILGHFQGRGLISLRYSRIAVDKPALLASFIEPKLVPVGVLHDVLGKAGWPNQVLHSDINGV